MPKIYCKIYCKIHLLNAWFITQFLNFYFGQKQTKKKNI